tara:strand:- start:12113 stop:12823 length:711 start_codon:yes stop_codon:yes gene_type:complete
MKNFLFKLNKKNVIFVVLLILVFNLFNFPQNIFFLVKDNYKKRLSNSYEYCGSESIGFLNYIKNNYKDYKDFEIINYFQSPNPHWFYKNFTKKAKGNFKILLGYNNDEIYLESRDTNFVSEQLKKFNKISEIQFNYNDDISKKKFNLKIYQESIRYNFNRLLYSSNFTLKTKGKNTFKLNRNFTEESSFNNSNLLIKIDGLNILKISDFKIITKQPNNNHEILEKHKNCYLIKTND